MTTIALVSIKGAPGVTTTAVALAAAWSTEEPALVAEVDPDGGALGPLCGLSLEDRGLRSLAVAGRHDGSVPDVLDHCQPFGPSHLPILVAPVSAEQTLNAVASLDVRFNRCLEASDHVVFLDAGRFRPDTSVSRVLAHADLVIVVARPTLLHAEAIAARTDALNGLGARVNVLLVGDRPYEPDEFTSALGISVVGVIEADRRGAEAMLSVPNSMFAKRSLLMRSARAVAAGIREEMFTTARVVS